jgi:hypothetical protein
MVKHLRGYLGLAALAVHQLPFKMTLGFVYESCGRCIREFREVDCGYSFGNVGDASEATTTGPECQGKAVCEVCLGLACNKPCSMSRPKVKDDLI